MTGCGIRDDIELVNRPATTINDSLQQSLQDCSTHTFVDCNVKHNGVNFHENHRVGVSTDLKTMAMRYGWEHLSFITNDETDDHKMSKSPMKIKTERHQCWNGSLNTSNVQRIFISMFIIFSHCVWYNFNKLASKRGCQVDHQKKNIVFPAFCMVSIPENCNGWSVDFWRTILVRSKIFHSEFLQCNKFAAKTSNLESLKHQPIPPTE